MLRVYRELQHVLSRDTTAVLNLQLLTFEQADHTALTGYDFKFTSGTEKRVSSLSKNVPAHRRDSRRPNSLLAVPGGPMYSMCS